jgi:predicted acetyltransferase
MGLSAYTATIRGIMEGPGTPEEKEMKRKKFIERCSMWPDDPEAKIVGAINLRAALASLRFARGGNRPIGFNR